MEFACFIVNTLVYLHKQKVTSQSYTPLLIHTNTNISTNTNTCRYRVVQKSLATRRLTCFSFAPLCIYL